MTITRTCAACGTAILAAHAKRKYCSQECYQYAYKQLKSNAARMRRSPPRPLARRGEFSVGQTVRVPAVERRTIDGREVRVTVTEYATVRKVTARYIVVSVGNVTRRCTREQLAACAPKELAVQFGHAISVGGDAS